VPQREADGSVLWHGSALDITERKAIDRAIFEGELRFRSVFHNSPVAMSLTRIGDDRILQVNDAWTQLFGWTEAETKGHTLLDLDCWFNPEDRHRLFKDFQDVGMLTDWPLHARHKDGTSMQLRLAVSAIQVEGEPCVLAVLLDHTKLHQAKQALIQLNQSLEHRVAQELSRRMDQERMLVHQSRLAAMGEMIGNIAHQWRQPLNALAMTLGNIKDARRYGQLTDDYLDASIGQGNVHIQRMSSTITDFMDYFRPEKAPRQFSLREQIRSALKLAAASLDRHRIAVEVAEGQEVFASGHANEFSQVLMNLLANASDAIQSSGAPSGTICIDLAAEGNLARLRVSDDGGGIRTEPIDRIFEPYFTDKPTGTGLGLYMSRMLLEQSMHGTLAARNIPGGAEFTITLPLAGPDHDH
jgi:PAS domain S-box-containing protein